VSTFPENALRVWARRANRRACSLIIASAALHARSVSAGCAFSGAIGAAGRRPHECKRVTEAPLLFDVS
jgi:hypothetical protein